MKVLVTGGAGAIGGNITHALVNDPEVNGVTVLDDLSSGYFENLPAHSKLRFIRGSVGDDAILNDLFYTHDFDGVIHLAASFANQTSVENPRRDLEVNGLGMLKMLEHASKAKVKRFVYSSSSCVYGHRGGILKEDNYEFFTETPYAATKLLGERYLHFFYSYHGLDAVTLRFFNTYGPGEKAGPQRNVIPNFISLALQKKPLPITGDGTETRDFNYISDTVKGVVLALKKPGIGGKIFNIASGRETTILKIAAEINRITRNPAGIQFQDRRKWDTVSQRLASIREAQTHLGYHPDVSIEQGLQKTTDWLMARHLSEVTV